jgi:hypothetical protein
MWRPAHGATTRPGPCRPGSGYGRAVGRPGPRAGAVQPDEGSSVVLDGSAFDELEDLVRRTPGWVVEQEVEAPASAAP